MKTNVVQMKIVVVIIFWLAVVSAQAHIMFRAKFLGNVKVNGQGGRSEYAITLYQCLAFCNKDPTCDAINYYSKLRKCRMFKRCSRMTILRSEQHYFFYAKRPLMTNADSDYVYEAESDSCLKLTKQKVKTYAEADRLCGEDEAYLVDASLDTSLQRISSRMLEIGDVYSAWVHSPKVLEKRFAKNSRKECF